MKIKECFRLYQILKLKKINKKLRANFRINLCTLILFFQPPNLKLSITQLNEYKACENEHHQSQKVAICQIYLFQLKNNGRLDVKLLPACWLACNIFVKKLTIIKMAIYFEE